MGFYSPAVLVKDAQRHGLRVLPVDVQKSEWLCTIEYQGSNEPSVRLGLMYAKGLRQTSGEALVSSRKDMSTFLTTEDFTQRVPILNRKELTQLARIGALNNVGDISHRRDALWQVEQAGRAVGPLLRKTVQVQLPNNTAPPLRRMVTEERLVADYSGTGLTIGPHPMAYQRMGLRERRIYSAKELSAKPDGATVRMAGCVIARQRPGTASGFVFLSMEDETGIANVIIHPDLFERERILVTRAKFLLIEGKLQNEDTVVHVRASSVAPLTISHADIRSHDFH
jgi:error-prone DNA polymerase